MVTLRNLLAAAASFSGLAMMLVARALAHCGNQYRILGQQQYPCNLGPTTIGGAMFFGGLALGVTGLAL